MVTIETNFTTLHSYDDMATLCELRGDDSYRSNADHTVNAALWTIAAALYRAADLLEELVGKDR